MGRSAKKLSARSKTVPAEIFIGETPKRSRAVPPNQDALMRRAARTAAVKRGASGPAEDDRVRPRGGAANVERVTRRQRLSRLYADRQVNVKARDAKTVGAKKSAKTFSPEAEVGARPEDRYGVRQRAPARNKGPRASRSRERAGLVA